MGLISPGSGCPAPRESLYEGSTPTAAARRDCNLYRRFVYHPRFDLSIRHRAISGGRPSVQLHQRLSNRLIDGTAESEPVLDIVSLERLGGVLSSYHRAA
jgi:hypothetical protein